MSQRAMVSPLRLTIRSGRRQLESGVFLRNRTTFAIQHEGSRGALAAAGTALGRNLTRRGQLAPCHRSFATASQATFNTHNGGRGTRPRRSRLFRFSLVLVVLGGIGAVGWQIDKQFYASAITRSVRALCTGLVITIDFKLNFNPKNSSEIEALHQRVADRLHHVVQVNQGLFIKMGQAIGLQAALLPKPYRDAFSNIFDAAPMVPYPEIEQVFKQDFDGRTPDDMFESFDRVPVASASIAQVHLATVRRRAGGREWTEKVAVKVQKPAIRKQMEWDLWSYRTLMYFSEQIFAMPLYFIADYVSEQMRLETSFLHEANNARKCAALLAETPELRDKVYVPKVYPEVAQSDRVMVMEYVDGCKLTDRQKIESWGYKPRDVMDTAIEVASAMTFTWGFVHCDPHPGNILVRPDPKNPKKPQVILIDHGLYIPLSDKFKGEYCTLWRSLFVLDIPSIERIAKEWGIILDVNMFASAILLRPFKVDKAKQQQADGTPPPPPMSEYEQQVELKRRLRTMLENELLIPRELIFLTRCQRMMQANNQSLGSPSPRINITAHWAEQGYSKAFLSAQNRKLYNIGLTQWLRDKKDRIVFRLALLALDASFWSARIRQWWNSGREGWEDQLQHQFEKMAKDEFGIDLQDDVFLG